MGSRYHTHRPGTIGEWTEQKLVAKIALYAGIKSGKLTGGSADDPAAGSMILDKGQFIQWGTGEDSRITYNSYGEFQASVYSEGMGFNFFSDQGINGGYFAIVDEGNNASGLSLQLKNTKNGTWATANADEDTLGSIVFGGHDSADAAAVGSDTYQFTTFGSIVGTISDVTHTDESGKIVMNVMAGGTAGTAGLKNLFSIGGERKDAGTNHAGSATSAAQPCEVIVNDDSIDCDFRVESDGNTHMLFVDGGNNGVGIGTDTARGGLTVVNDYQTTAFESLLSDGQFNGEVLRYSPGADDTLTAGQIYFLHTDGTWDQADADAVATGASQLLGVGLGGSSRTVGAVTRGFIRIPSTEILNLPGSGACDGLPVYISTTAGHFDFTAPSGDADYVRIVGYAIDDDSSDVLVYFDPDKSWVEVSA
jgi:hypothetical protein